MKIITSLLAIVALSSFAAVNAEEKAKLSPEELFKKKDANGDGKVCKTEFTTGSKDAAKAEKAFAAKDKDGSGDLCATEFAAKPEKKKE
jgi:Ca2+-binding EF-hand superfamily protein